MNLDNKEKKALEAQFSKDFIEGMKLALSYSKQRQNISLVDYINSQVNNKEKIRKNLNENTYFIKINAKISFLSDKDFIAIVKNFRSIVENFCELLKLDSENLEIRILSAEPGCFNINFGINLNVKEFNIIKLPNSEFDLIKYIVEYLTGKKITSYDNKPIQLLKDCTTGYLTKKIPKDDKKLQYIDIKKSKEAKKIIFKTIKNIQDVESVGFNGELITASEMDLVV